MSAPSLSSTAAGGGLDAGSAPSSSAAEANTPSAAVDQAGAARATLPSEANSTGIATTAHAAADGQIAAAAASAVPDAIDPSMSAPHAAPPAGTTKEGQVAHADGMSHPTPSSTGVAFPSIPPAAVPSSALEASTISADVTPAAAAPATVDQASVTLPSNSPPVDASSTVLLDKSARAERRKTMSKERAAAAVPLKVKQKEEARAAAATQQTAEAPAAAEVAISLPQPPASAVAPPDAAPLPSTVSPTQPSAAEPAAAPLLPRAASITSDVAATQLQPTAVDAIPPASTNGVASIAAQSTTSASELASSSPSSVIAVGSETSNELLAVDSSPLFAASTDMTDAPNGDAERIAIIDGPTPLAAAGSSSAQPTSSGTPPSNGIVATSTASLASLDAEPPLFTLPAPTVAETNSSVAPAAPDDASSSLASAVVAPLSDEPSDATSASLLTLESATSAPSIPPAEPAIATTDPSTISSPADSTAAPTVAPSEGTLSSDAASSTASSPVVLVVQTAARREQALSLAAVSTTPIAAAVPEPAPSPLTLTIPSTAAGANVIIPSPSPVVESAVVPASIVDVAASSTVPTSGPVGVQKKYSLRKPSSVPLDQSQLIQLALESRANQQQALAATLASAVAPSSQTEAPSSSMAITVDQGSAALAAVPAVVSPRRTTLSRQSIDSTPLATKSTASPAAASPRTAGTVGAAKDSTASTTPTATAAAREASKESSKESSRESSARSRGGSAKRHSSGGVSVASTTTAAAKKSSAFSFAGGGHTSAAGSSTHSSPHQTTKRLSGGSGLSSPTAAKRALNAHPSPATSSSSAAAKPAAPKNLTVASASPSVSSSSSHRTLKHSASQKAMERLLHEFQEIDEGSAPVFTRALQSDLSSSDALALFLRVQSVSGDFRDFTDSEMRLMASDVFSVLRLPAGEKIITKGEPATFLGIVLQGSFSAVISPAATVELREGNLVGEMSYYESHSRSADIVTREEAVLAVLTFQELDSMAQSGEAALTNLYIKLIKMFAVVSIKKLRSLVNAAPSTPNAAAAVQTAAAAAAVMLPSKSPAHSRRNTGELVSPTSSSHASGGGGGGGAKESLYRVRLALDAAKDAAQRMAESERAERLKVEKKNLSVAASLDRYKHLASKLKDALQKAAQKAEHQQREMDEMRDQQVALQEELQASHESHDEVYQRLCAEVDLRAAENRVAAEARTALQSEYDQTIAHLRGDLTSVQCRGVDLEMDLQRMLVEVAQVKKAAEERVRDSEQGSMGVRHSLQAREYELDELHAAKRLSDEQLKNTMGLNSQLSIQNANLKKALQEEQEKVAAAGIWKTKASELGMAIAQEKKLSLATITNLVVSQSSQSTDINRLWQVLKHVTVSAYVKLWKLKRSTKALHMQISELLVNILEGHVLANSSGPQGASQSNEIAADGDNTHLLIKKSLMRKKKQYLDSVERRTNGLDRERAVLAAGGASPSMGDASPMHPLGLPMSGGKFWNGRSKDAPASAHPRPSLNQVKLHDLLTSLEDEVYKLRHPFDEVLTRVQHWKRTSDVFCARTIELTEKMLEQEKELAKVELKNQTLRTILTKHNDEYAAVLQVNATLKQEVARFKNEMAAYKQSTKVLEVAGDVLGARKAELENLESRIGLHKQQLQHVQRQYVDTVEALNAAVTGSAHGGGEKLPPSPPKGAPHFPPMPPSAWGTLSTASLHSGMSPGLSQLLASTLGVTPAMSTAPSTANLPGHTAPVCQPHEDPEAHQFASMRSIQQASQQELALSEYQKFSQVQFILENQQESDAHQQQKRKGGSHKKKPVGARHPLLSDPSVRSLAIADNYATVFSARNYTDRDTAQAIDAGRDDAARERLRSRAEEEEAKSMYLSSPTLRVQQIRNNNLRSANHNPSASTTSSSNIGGVGGVSTSFGVLPLPSSTHDMSASASRTSLVHKPTTAPLENYRSGSSGGLGRESPRSSSLLPRLDQGRSHDYAGLYGLDGSQSARSASAVGGSRPRLQHQQGLHLSPPSSYAHTSAGLAPSSFTPERNSFRGFTQYQSTTSLAIPTVEAQAAAAAGGLTSPRKKKAMASAQQQPQQPMVVLAQPMAMMNAWTQMYASQQMYHQMQLQQQHQHMQQMAASSSTPGSYTAR